MHRTARQESPERRPRDPRSQTGVRIEIRKSPSAKFRAEILDISRTGFQLDITVNWHKGDRLLVHLPGLRPLPATVQWHNDFRTGCKFEVPISEYVYDDLLKRLSG
jgi:hypothetical protein